MWRVTLFLINATPRLVAVLVLCAGLAAVGCGSDDSNPEPTPTAGTKPPKAPSTPTTARNEGYALRRQGEPPPGVLEQVTYQEGGGPGCEGNSVESDGPVQFAGLHPGAPKLDADPEANRTRVGDEFMVCFPGFDSSQPMQVTLTGPVTREYTSKRAEFPAHAIYPDFLGEEPPGTYEVVAEQDGQQERSSFELLPADGPVLRVKAPRSATPKPGADIRIIGAGFPPRSTARFAIYRSEKPIPGGSKGVFRSAPTVAVDEHGVFVYRVLSAEADRGCYKAWLPDSAGIDKNADFQNRRFCIDPDS